MNPQDRQFLWKLSMLRCRRLLCACFLWMSLAGGARSSTWLLAQSELATLTGPVADSSGGVLANADVTVKKQGTNISSPGRSKEKGGYLLPSLKPRL